MIYATVDADGRATGFYNSEINTIPEGAFEISAETYRAWVDNTQAQCWNGSGLVPCDPLPWQGQEPGPMYARTYKSDIWRRATDEEVVTIDAGLTEAPARLRRLWDDSQVLMHEADEFPMIRDVMVDAFGEKRANELLAASYWEP